MADRYASLKQGLVGCWIPSVSGSGLLLPDLSGRGNNGSLVNMDASDWVSGQYGRALDFDGVDDYVETNLIQPASVFTVTGFASIDSFANSPLIYTWIGQNGDYGFLETNSTGSQLYFGVRSTLINQLSSRTYTLSQSLTAGSFFHFATVKTPGVDTGELYVNGVRQTSFTGQLYATPGTGNLRLAAYQTVNALFMDGRLDDIRVYNRVLTEPEIRLLASRPGIGLQPSPTRFIAREKKTGLRRKILTGQT